MLAYKVSKSIEINKPPKEVLTYLADFKNWPAWSPWIILEPECDLVYSPTQGNVDDGYQWSGDRVGSGAMTLESISLDSLTMELNFFTPFKSRADVGFDVTPAGEGCKVTWTMDAKVPWFMFFMKGFFKGLIGMDYDRGLRMLKSKLETGEVLSKLKENGIKTLPDTHYAGLSATGTIPELEALMKAHISKLVGFIESGELTPIGEMFCFYKSMDMKSGVFEFSTCFPIAEDALVPSELEKGRIPSCEVFSVEHTGSYWFLGNAWSYASSLTRYKGIKTKRKPMGIERYLNTPTQVDEKDLRTEIMMFRK